MDFDYMTVRESSYGGFDIHGFKPYPRHSVLAGQMAKCFVTRVETREEAEARFPGIQGGSAWTDPQVNLSHLPGEDDPVPGGMYPDDTEYDPDEDCDSIPWDTPGY